MGRSRISFTYDDINLRSSIPGFKRRVNGALTEAVGFTSTEGTASMKTHAPWTDRTGAARAGLHAVPEEHPGRYEITFSGTVHYQIWLEIANSGRYQIIMPTVRQEGDALMGRLRGLFGKLEAIK
jgi:hypothetical protein